MTVRCIIRAFFCRDCFNRHFLFINTFLKSQIVAVWKVYLLSEKNVVYPPK
ncbi:hypothetical protein F3P51_03150 [Bacteroides fragilis]|uniref:Uncharacterized protein n=2 Tax=Bacteroides fragilis TaxID=817 RepID=A0A5C6J6X1_BACFG|nr:hypothetical protein F2Z40_14575 [Bacteroides fragilis]BAD48960.1 hypothetical protein BF2213 [Bacteroides fragilis YCH46]KAA5091151.1 hypothetical protein F2Z82_08510 [Bacteroides fragilis]KAA5094355.1 hypothetical protein F2Z45_05025 [Bacteroides fragilis]KAA5098384.1 hypothetical protein F2Z46_15865 [Bacteroides fragilis]